MTYVIGTQIRSTDAPALRENIGALIRPKLEALGAAYVIGQEALTGDTPGLFSIGSRWDSLDTAMKGLEAFYTDAEILALAQASPTIEPVGRMIGIVEGEAGDTQGTFAILVASTMSSPDPSRMDQLLVDMQEMTSQIGCNGVRVARIVAGGEQTGAYMNIVYADSTDSLFGAISETRNSDAMMGHFGALGIEIQGRMLVRNH